MPSEELALEFTFPAGPSPNVFTEGWVFGARAIVNPGTPDELDISHTVEWSGTGVFAPPVGALSRPRFSAVGENRIDLRVEYGGRIVTQSLTVSALSPEHWASVGSHSWCPSDTHGCPSCPHAVMGVVETGSPTVTVRGAQAARQGDTGTHAACCSTNTFVITGSDQRIFIDGRPGAHMGDPTQHCGGQGHLSP